MERLLLYHIGLEKKNVAGEQEPALCSPTMPWAFTCGDEAAIQTTVCTDRLLTGQFTTLVGY